MTRHLISTGSPYEDDYAYSRAVVTGDMCFVAGTTGFDYSTMSIPPDALSQARNALATITSTLATAGFRIGQVVRADYVVSRPEVMVEIAPALRDAFDDVRPASTAIVAGLIDPRMLVEITVTALR